MAERRHAPRGHLDLVVRELGRGARGVDHADGGVHFLDNLARCFPAAQLRLLATVREDLAVVPRNRGREMPDIGAGFSADPQLLCAARDP